ncbi:hypothetical protein OG21DRAFT_1250038 [Imleria badia]|nr:hypothetical protein OG21DRAFT_1250038 [Imleria badia]
MDPGKTTNWSASLRMSFMLVRVSSYPLRGLTRMLGIRIFRVGVERAEGGGQEKNGADRGQFGALDELKRLMPYLSSLLPMVHVMPFRPISEAV